MHYFDYYMRYYPSDKLNKIILINILMFINVFYNFLFSLMYPILRMKNNSNDE